MPYNPAMAQRRFHYEQAFEAYLREKAIPYVAVDEAKRALTVPANPTPSRSPSPSSSPPSTQDSAPPSDHEAGAMKLAPASLKSFDFVVYSQAGPNLLVDVKGRKHSGRSSRSLDNWVTEADVDSMVKWEQLFGEGFVGAFAFLYWCEAQPPDALFHEVFTHGDRWYALLAIKLSDYRLHMKQRSPKWQTLNMPAEAFNRLSVPLRELL